jgi:hypothetical protein
VNEAHALVRVACPFGQPQCALQSRFRAKELERTKKFYRIIVRHSARHVAMLVRSTRTKKIAREIFASCVPGRTMRL